eukprot:365477-Chlamydomonas_euryale.AAC.1
MTGPHSGRAPPTLSPTPRPPTRSRCGQVRMTGPHSGRAPPTLSPTPCPPTRSRCGQVHATGPPGGSPPPFCGQVHVELRPVVPPFPCSSRHMSYASKPHVQWLAGWLLARWLPGCRATVC